MRHGRTVWNEEGRLQGHKDSPLLPESIDLVHAMAEFFRDKEIGKIYSSPLRRCSATADIVSDVLGLPFARDARLMECAHGLCDGMLLSDTRASCPDYYAQWEKDRWNTAWPGGESYRDVFLRAQSFAADLNRLPGGGDVQAEIPDHERRDCEGENSRAASRTGTGHRPEGCLVIAHAQVNMCLVGALLSLTAAEILDLRQKNGTIYIASENLLRKVEFA
jgi:broad specificity phosphatase PhoE